VPAIAWFWRYRNQWAVRKSDWKYLKIGNDEYLFNLKEDLGEKENLIEQHPEIVLEMKGMLDRWETEMENYNQKMN